MKPNELRIGMRVRYVPRHANGREQTETGEVVTWRHHQGDTLVFVRYGAEAGSKATPLALLQREEDPI